MRSMDFVRCYNPSQAYTVKHVSNQQLTATVGNKATHVSDGSLSRYTFVFRPPAIPHEPDLEDRGLYWAVRHVDTRQV